MFGIVEVRGREHMPVYDPNENHALLTFEDGDTAAEHAKRLTEIRAENVKDPWSNYYGQKPVKFQPRALKDDGSWRDAEKTKHTKRAKVPDTWPTPTADHFLHVSKDDNTKVAFYETSAKAMIGRLTLMAPGRYLQKYHSDTLTPDQIRDLATQYGALHGSNDVFFAVTADEIEEVYVNGPNSCMSKEADQFDSPFHPVRIYAAGDLQVAYLKRGNAITARTVCWPAKKLWSRIYGDYERLATALIDLGYTNGDMNGAKLRLHHSRNGDDVVAPYLDGQQWVDVDGDHLVIGGSDYCCEQTNGYTCTSDSAYSSCDECGTDIHDEDDCYYINNVDATYCIHCRSRNSFICEYYDERFLNRDRVIMANGAEWSQLAVDGHALYCEGTDEYYPEEQVVNLYDGRCWSEDYANKHAAECDWTNELYPLTELITLEGGARWNIQHARNNVGICEVTWQVLCLDDLCQLDNGEWWCHEYYELYASYLVSTETEEPEDDEMDLAA